MTVAFTGGCACGAVRYASTSPPSGMVNCHCRDCQRASGAGFSATVIVATSSLEITSGEPAYHSLEADSGNTATRGFCGQCGSPLFASSSAWSEYVGIKAGSLDDPSWYQPSADVWTLSAQPWDSMDPNVEKFEKCRPR